MTLQVVLFQILMDALVVSRALNEKPIGRKLVAKPKNLKDDVAEKLEILNINKHIFLF